jgi:hypothetical protein
MSLDQNNQLKFQDGQITEPLEIKKAGYEELPFGNKYVVHIKPLITGEDHFLPSDGLQKKIKGENVDKGDKITIEKVPKSDKYPYGYFSVSVVEKAKGPNTSQSIANSPVGAGFAQKDDKSQFEESLEHSDSAKLEILWKEYKNKQQ